MSYTLEFLSMLVLFPLIRRSIKCSVFLNLLRVYFDYSQTEDHACVVLLYVFLCSRLAAKAGCLLLVGPQTMLAMCAGLGMRAFVGLLTSPLPVSSPVKPQFNSTYLERGNLTNMVRCLETFFVHQKSIKPAIRFHQ